MTPLRVLSPRIDASQIVTGRFNYADLEAAADKFFKGAGIGVACIEADAGGGMPSFIAGDLVAFESTVPASTTIATYTKLKETQLGSGGTIRVKFTAKVTSGTGYGQVWKNGVAFGTERLLTTSYAVYSEDLVFTSGDLLQIYGKVTGAFTLSVSLLQLCSVTYHIHRFIA